MPNLPVNELTKLKQRTRITLILTLVVLGMGFISLFFISYFTQQKITQVTAARQEVINLQGLAANAQSLAEFAKANQSNLSALVALFPIEDDFVYVLQDIEELVQAVDPGGSVKLGASKPVKVSNQNTLPLTISLKVDLSTLSLFFRQLERLPYILEITGVDLKSPPQGGSVQDVTLNLRLYVADPFNP